MQRNTLSKSRYTDGLQCAKRLWLGIHERQLATPPSEGQQAIFDAGTRIGELARGRWPEGVLVEEDYWQHDASVSATESLIADPSIEVIFEAGFTELDVRIRSDVMIRVPDTQLWDLVEVKSSTSPKPQYDDDIAIQALVIETAGVRLRKKMVLVIDNSYVFDGVELDLQNYLSLHDRTSKVDAKEQETRESLDRFHKVANGDVPDIEPSPHCRQPYLCSFWDYCTAEVPKNWIMELPRIGAKTVAELRSQGVESIRGVPSGFPLTDQQAKVRTAVITDDEWVSPELNSVLIDESPANHFLDFETFNPGIPIYEGTRPYEKIPFQWSCHSKTDQGAIDHTEFLASPTSDPRRAFAESLIAHIGVSGSVVVYSSFEKGVLTALENQFPDLGDELRAIKERLWDLLEVVRNNYYHPEFHGSYSIKAVLPALVPELAYDDLALQAGDSASVSFQNLVLDKTLDDDDKNRIESELKAYCARDTLAMFKILGRLTSISA
jgi:hypothetical protein